MGAQTNTIKLWRTRMGLSQRAAAAALGVTQVTYSQWESGVSRHTGAQVTPPLTARLAAAALEHGIEPV